MDVRVAGVGSTRYGRLEQSLSELVREASDAALTDAQLATGDIGAVYAGTFSPGTFATQEHLGALVAEHARVLGVPATRLEGACASGSLAVIAGLTSILAGFHRAVLVVAVEKMTLVDTLRAGSLLALAGEYEREGRIGVPFPGVFALLARRHMHDFGTTRDHLDAVAIKAHDNGVFNAKAQFRRRITPEQIRESPPVCEPLTVYDCAPISDGASALVLTAPGVGGNDQDRISILGFGQASDSLSLIDRPSLTSFPATRQAAGRAYEMAGVGPADLDFVEVHDCFTIAEIIAIEDLGLFAAGKGGFFTAEGVTAADGDLPVNPSGGLKAKGHPVGATGVGQIVESVSRLRGQDRRLGEPGLAMTHNLGGTGATAVVTILGREG